MSRREARAAMASTCGVPRLLAWQILVLYGMQGVDEVSDVLSTLNPLESSLAADVHA